MKIGRYYSAQELDKCLKSSDSNIDITPSMSDKNSSVGGPIIMQLPIRTLKPIDKNLSSNETATQSQLEVCDNPKKSRKQRQREQFDRELNKKDAIITNLQEEVSHKDEVIRRLQKELEDKVEHAQQPAKELQESQDLRVGNTAEMTMLKAEIQKRRQQARRDQDLIDELRRKTTQFELQKLGAEQTLEKGLVYLHDYQQVIKVYEVQLRVAVAANRTLSEQNDTLTQQLHSQRIPYEILRSSLRLRNDEVLRQKSWIRNLEQNTIRLRNELRNSTKRVAQLTREVECQVNSLEAMSQTAQSWREITCETEMEIEELADEKDACVLRIRDLERSVFTLLAEFRDYEPPPPYPAKNDKAAIPSYAQLKTRNEHLEHFVYSIEEELRMMVPPPAFCRR